MCSLGQGNGLRVVDRRRVRRRTGLLVQLPLGGIPDLVVIALHDGERFALHRQRPLDCHLDECRGHVRRAVAGMERTSRLDESPLGRGEPYCDLAGERLGRGVATRIHLPRRDVGPSNVPRFRPPNPPKQRSERSSNGCGDPEDPAIDQRQETLDAPCRGGRGIDEVRFRIGDGSGWHGCNDGKNPTRNVRGGVRRDPILHR